MRQLHVVGVSDDGATLLLGTAENAAKVTHRIALDARLRAAVRGQLGPPGGDRAEIALTPKEIQARLRAGATPEEVAKAAGVPVARVMPYAAPVEAERLRVVDDARSAVVHRHRGPDGSKPLGELVDARLREVPGLKPESVDWTARRRHDGAWEVALSYAARGGRRSATWLWRPLERDLTSLDVAASRLAADGGGTGRTTTRRRPAAERPKPAAKRAAKPAARKAAKRAKPAAAASKPAAKKATRKAAKPATKAAGVRKTAAKAAAGGRSTAKKAATTRTAPKRAAAKPATRTATKPAKAASTRTAAKATPTRAAAKPTRARTAAKAVGRKAAPAAAAAAARTTQPPKKRTRRAVPRRPEVTAPPALRVVEPIEEPAVAVVETPQVEQVEQPAAAAAQAAPRRRGAHVPLPSWSDVLLGVQPTPRGDANRRGDASDD